MILYSKRLFNFLLKISSVTNIKQFPADFMFQLTDKEIEHMVSQNAIPSKQHLGGLLTVTVLTKSISKHLMLDVKKFNEQYPAIEIKEFNNAHDRFIIIDKNTVYHFGASLKDLGKKWFAFSKMDIGAGSNKKIAN